MKGMPATFNSRVKANLFYWFPAGCCGHCVKKATVRMKKNSFQTQARWMSGSKGKKTFIKLSDYFIRLILRGEKCLRLAIYGSMCHIWKALCGWAEALGHKRNGFVFPDSRNFVWNMVLITAHLLYETHKAIWLKRSLKVISGEEANNTIFHLVLCAVWILRSCFFLHCWNKEPYLPVDIFPAYNVVVQHI